jgi:starch synthase (maltosyl-transferring)
LRIYCVDTAPHPHAAEPGEALDYLEQHIAQSGALGFSHVLLAGPVGTAFYRNPAVAEAPATGGAQRLAALAQLGRCCNEHGLGLLLDLTLPPLHTASEALAQNPVCGESQDDDEWSAELTVLAQAGVDGFRCASPASLPAQRWQQLLATVRERAGRALAFLAWTPGLSPAQLQALSGCGFDSVFSSLPWWDFRNAWLADEQQRLRALGARLINPLADLHAAAGELSEAAARRLLCSAALCGDGLLMPAGFEHGGTHRYELTQEVVAANAWLARNTAPGVPAQPALRMLSGADAGMTLLARTLPDPHDAALATSSQPVLIAINRSLDAPARYPVERILVALAPRTGAAGLIELSGREPNLETETADAPGRYPPLSELKLAAGAVGLYRVVAAMPVRPAQAGNARERKAAQASRAALNAALHAPRIVIENLQPACDAGRFAVRRIVGERVTVEADIWMDGHELLSAALCWRAIGAKSWQEAPMRLLGNDRWRGVFALEQLGRYEFTVQAWHDPFATWLDEVGKKSAAGQDLILETEEGRLLALQLIESATAVPQLSVKTLRQLTRLAQALNQPATDAPDPGQRERYLQLLLDPATRSTLAASGVRPFNVQHESAYPVEAERLAARYGSWYELFPRSQTSDPARHGTFDDVIARLPAISAMGFDVLYFPPIHPIGQSQRKGRNNSLNATPDEPGSPYAIGSADGGHDALHPQLGNLDDFQRLLDAAAAHGLEIALDFAIQCAPDHPWLSTHPEWFSYRPDGTVRHAENPPKKYQDIVNVDFYAAHAPALWQALCEVVLFWAARGVRIFRVDNPHTKPLPFWEWLIAEVRALYPDAIFLAEAFTRPKPMARLAKLGFSQSYTYFTWRNDKRELSTYITELTQTPLREYFRPHFFVNTPDINPYFLHRSGRAGFLIRAALASLLSGLWGMLSGYELCEAEPLVLDGQVKEEYANSEKFEIKPRDWQRSGNIVAEITRLNALRRNYPALHHHLGVHFYAASNDQVLYFARFTEPPSEPVGAALFGPVSASAPGRFGDCVLLVAINLDPFNTQQATIELPLWEWGLPDHAALQVEDLMQGHRFVWRGKLQLITLHPQQLPFAVWQVSPLPDSRTDSTP